MEPLIVFLDTNVILKAFSDFRKNGFLPDYITDKTTLKYTFEKCIFEAYMAFRGVGGKKPDEGRGDWAQRNLNQENDPRRIGDLSSQFHGGDSQYTFFWANQILEFHVNDRLENQEQLILDYVSDDHKQEALAQLQQMAKLLSQRQKFEAICNEFKDFLHKSEIRIIPYIQVFEQREIHVGIPNPLFLDSLVRDTVLPSEDFEIIYAAMTISTDIFVTDDKRLITCVASLGLNFRLSFSNFCESKDYAKKAQEIKEFKGGY